MRGPLSRHRGAPGEKNRPRFPYHGRRDPPQGTSMNQSDRTSSQTPPLTTRLRTGARMLIGLARPPAQYGISHPKSGRTWLRAMVGRVLCNRTGLPDSDLLHTRKLTAAAGVPVLKWHHGGASLKSPCPRHDELVFDRRFEGKSIIFVMRDPRDTLVSSYFQAAKRSQSIDGPVGEIGEFVRSSERGILKWIAFHNLWHDNLAKLRSFHLVRYEAMHADPQGTLRGVLEAMGLPDVTDAELANAIEFARFDNLKRLESSGRLQDSALKPKDAADPDSFKVRKGQVGGYRESLGEADIAFIEETLRSYPCPLYLENYPQP